MIPIMIFSLLLPNGYGKIQGIITEQEYMVYQYLITSIIFISQQDKTVQNQS